MPMNKPIINYPALTEKAEGEHPEVAKKLKDLKTHFVMTHGQAQGIEHYYSILMFMAYPNITSSMYRMAHEANLKHNATASTMILEALAVTPEPWLEENKSAIHRRDVIRGTHRFYRAGAEEIMGGLLDKMREMARIYASAYKPQDHEALIRGGIDTVHEHHNEFNVRMGALSLVHMAAALIEDDGVRKKTMKALAEEHGHKPSARLHGIALRTLSKIAEKLEINTDGIAELKKMPKEKTLSASMKKAAANTDTPHPPVKTKTELEIKFEIFMEHGDI